MEFNQIEAALIRNQSALIDTVSDLVESYTKLAAIVSQSLPEIALEHKKEINAGLKSVSESYTKLVDRKEAFINEFRQPNTPS